MADIQVTTKVRVPAPPNYLCYDGGQIDVADMTDGDLVRVADAMGAALLRNAEARRKLPKVEGKSRG